MRAFELTSARYDEHQRAMETYWSLRWLLQEKVRDIDATVLRENLVRLEGLPLFVRVSSLPKPLPGRACGWRCARWISWSARSIASTVKHCRAALRSPRRNRAKKPKL